MAMGLAAAKINAQALLADFSEDDTLVCIGTNVNFTDLTTGGTSPYTWLWDFGDGTRPVNVRSDGNAKIHDPNGYAVTTHVFAIPGDYIVRAERSSSGYPAMAHLHVSVEAINK